MQESGCAKPVGVGYSRIESLPFSSIPSQNRLFLDYLNDPLSLRRYYPSAVGSHAEVSGRADEVLRRYAADRDRVCDALVRLNASYRASPETLANIDLLRRPDTVAVLTGQQTGIFTGPLFTIYKALSAIKMAQCLHTRGTNAVAVFWMATEDHDLEEVSEAFVVDPSGRVSSVRSSFSDADTSEPVGAVRFDDTIGALSKQLFELLPETEFTSEIHSLVLDHWREGGDFGNAFGSTITALLGKFGVIVVDPRDDELKRLAAPIYADAVDRSGEIVNALTLRSKELEAAGYQPQVLIEDDYFPLFYHTDDGRRLSLRRTSGGLLKIKGERTEFSLDDLRQMLLSDPSRFSPGVMLRPVVQDYLFPTLCYFGGGAEVAYFAQISEVYRVLERPVTPIFHRQSFTVVEARHARTLERLGLEFVDLFRGEPALLPAIVDKFIDPESAKIFDEAARRINDELDRIEDLTAKLDATIAANLATRRRKIAYHISALRTKYRRRSAEKDEEIGRRLNAAFDQLVPGGQLQERTINVFSFLDRLGPAFVDTLLAAVDLDDKGHRVIYL